MRVLLLTLWKPSKGGVVTHVMNLMKYSKNEFLIISYPPLNLPVLRALSFLVVGFLRGLGMTYDVIHAHYALPQGLLGVFLKKIKKRPLVLTLHGSDVTLLGRNPLTKPVLGFVLRRADRVIAVSEFLRREALALGASEEKTRAIYAGVEPRPGMVKGVTAQGKRILFIGALVRQKGADLLIRAFKKVAEKHEDAELLLVGDGGERRNLQGLSRALGVRVQFRGYVDKIDGVLRRSALLVLPSREEGFGLVLLEAMAAGVPVVATRVGGIPEVVVSGENGLLVGKEDVDALAEAIIKVLEEQDLRARLVLNGIRTAEKFKWDKMAGEVDELYRGLSDKAF
jgi:N-acetyl-alpha-D-glucosaminyl L-malate synthase BshA